MELNIVYKKEKEWFIEHIARIPRLWKPMS